MSKTTKQTSCVRCGNPTKFHNKIYRICAWCALLHPVEMASKQLKLKEEEQDRIIRIS